MDYGRAIRTLRAARRLSQKELAQRVSISPSYMSLLESGSRTPSSSTIASVSRAMNIPPFLLSLLASDAGDLDGIEVKQAQELGAHLLTVLTGDADRN